MDLANLLRNANSEKEAKQLSECALVLSKHFKRWKLVFPTHQVSEMQMAIYLSVLRTKLSPGALDAACTKVLETAKTFPKPAEILEASMGEYSGEFGGSPPTETGNRFYRAKKPIPELLRPIAWEICHEITGKESYEELTPNELCTLFAAAARIRYIRKNVDPQNLWLKPTAKELELASRGV